MGSLRDLSRSDKDRSEADSIRAQLFPRLKKFRAQEKSWNEIEDILKEEGYKEKGKPLTANALRKRYTKWVKMETSDTPTSESETEQPQGREDSDRFKQLEGGAALPALLPENAIVSSIANLVTLSNQLLEQVHQSHRMIERLEKRLEEQELHTSHTDIDDTEQPVTSRDLLELLKEITAGKLQMMHIEEERKDYVAREEVLELLEESVQDRIDTELKTMLSEEGSFSGELTHLIDQRLRTLFSGGEPVPETAHAGPGRGRKGKTHKKFSASLEETLFERVRSLPGQFSGHLTNALNAYLAVMEEEKKD